MVAQLLRFRTRSRMFTLPLLSYVCFTAIVGCGGKKLDTLPPPTSAVMGWSERGIASWYGHPYHGRRTSNGEVYDMGKLTAAHLSLPFNTWVRVTNLDNKESVEVRINDRGPFIKGRIIDLSRAGAQRIGMIGPGIARVRVQVVATPSMAYKGRKPTEVVARAERPARETPDLLEPPESIAPPAHIEPPADTSPERGQTTEPAVVSESGDAASPCSTGSFHGVQVGSFQDIQNAERMQGKMAHQYGTAQIVERQSEIGTLYRVITGRFTTRKDARDLQRRLQQDGIDGFVTPASRGDPADCL